jgi:hypothetical protein
MGKLLRQLKFQLFLLPILLIYTLFSIYPLLYLPAAQIGIAELYEF